MAVDMDDFSLLLRILEDIQANIGSIQNALYELRKKHKSLPKQINPALIKLENAQRDIGEVQVILVELDSYLAADPHPPPQAASESEAKLDLAPGMWLDPVSWLRKKNFFIKASYVSSGLDKAAEKAAGFLGNNYERLTPFYEAIKRRIAGGHQRKYSLQDSPPRVINDVTKFGQMMKKCGFFSDFRYINHDRMVIFDVQNDGRIKNFFTGEWLEWYVISVIRKFLNRHNIQLHKSQILRRVQGELPDGKEAEFDLLIGLPGDRILWIECKTGEWQNYLSRFYKLNQSFLKIDPKYAALVLLEELSEEERNSASELCHMQVVHFSQVQTWLQQALSAG